MNKNRLDEIVANARTDVDKRHLGYRERSLKIHPWICGRCSREFERANLHELTVHHKDHNHDNNPADGSNWENLCLYCHDNEHQRYVDAVTGYDPLASKPEVKASNFKPFAELKSLLHKP